MKILLITPTSNQVITFRSKLIEMLQSKEYQVSIITFDENNKDEILRRGIDFHSIKDSNRSINPFKILSLKRKIKQKIKLIKPDIVVTFMLKPNIFGTLAAKECHISNIFCMVEGAGDVFINSGIKWAMIRKYVCHMYKKSFSYAKKIIFLNNDDKKEFIEKKLVKKEKCEVILGIGIDLEKFSYMPVKNHNVFLMVSRMLKTKGVIEYCKIARIIKKKYPGTVFNYLGGEGTLKVVDIQEYIDDGSINYLGITDDVRPFYEECSCLILPSYREGFPVCVMEAQAIGRMVITSDTNGCREAIKNGYNGFLCSIKKENEIIEKITWLLENNKQFEVLGSNARLFAEKNFSEKEICLTLFNILGINAIN